MQYTSIFFEALSNKKTTTKQEIYPNFLGTHLIPLANPARFFTIDFYNSGKEGPILNFKSIQASRPKIFNIKE